MYSHGVPRPTTAPRTNTAQQAPAPAPVTFTSRPLPSGDCGFDAYGAPCRCRSFWPSPQTPVLCACGHHACYHAHEKPAGPNSLFAAKFAALEEHISHLAGYIEYIRTARAQTSTGTQLVDIEDKLMDVEDRVRGIETLTLGLGHRLDDLETRGDLIEHELDEIKMFEGDEPDYIEPSGLPSPAPTVTPSSPAAPQHETANPKSHIPRSHIITRLVSSKRPHADDGDDEDDEKPAPAGKKHKTEETSRRNQS